MAELADMSDVFELSGYVKSMGARLQNLAKVSDSIAADIDKFDVGLSSKKTELKGELDSIRAEITEMKEEVRSTQKIILVLINQLKNSIKADEYERFKKRMDIWAPESLVTRDEVKRVIDKE